MEVKSITDTEEYNQQGKVLFSLEKYNEAIEMYKRAESEDPMYKDTYFNIEVVKMMI